MQIGVQNGCPGVAQNFFVQAALPFSSQKQSLHPSLNPFGHVSQPTNMMHQLITLFMSQIMYTT